MLLVFFNYLPLSSKKVPDKICAASLEAHDLIKNLEGFRPEAYVKADQWLIGYGFAQYPSGAMPKAGDTISRERADEILVHEVNKISNYIAKLIQAPVSQNQFDALVSFAYSVGVGRFRDSTLLRKLNSEDYEATAQEFKRWVHINGEVSPGLVKRRERELGLFGDQ
jgi:lysozyme